MEQAEYKPHSGNVFLADVLLSCPFCGGEAGLMFIGNDYTKTRKVEIKCSNINCRATIINAGRRKNSEQVTKWSIESWNKRVNCVHPREKRTYIGRNMLRCGVCGLEFE